MEDKALSEAERWRASDWKEGIAIVAFLFMMVIGACATFEKIGKTLDDNREGIKTAVATAGEVASKISGIATALEEITKSVGGNVDGAIAKVKDSLSSIKSIFDLKVAGLERTIGEKPDDQTIWGRLLGLGLLIAGGTGARNVASGRKKKRHNGQIYGELKHLKDRLVEAESRERAAPAARPAGT